MSTTIDPALDAAIRARADVLAWEIMRWPQGCEMARAWLKQALRFAEGKSASLAAHIFRRLYPSTLQSPWPASRRRVKGARHGK